MGEELVAEAGMYVEENKSVQRPRIREVEPNKITQEERWSCSALISAEFQHRRACFLKLHKTSKRHITFERVTVDSKRKFSSLVATQ